MKEHLNRNLLIFNSLIGAFILLLNYNPEWHKIFMFNLFGLLVGISCIAIFVVSAFTHILVSIKQPIHLVGLTILYGLFLGNLFLNPLNIDSKPNNTFLTKMIAQEGGTFHARRILFDPEHKFHLLDRTLDDCNIYNGTYHIVGDTLFLKASILPENCKDTMYIKRNKTRLSYSKKNIREVMKFVILDIPAYKRLDTAKRTAFELSK